MRTILQSALVSGVSLLLVAQDSPIQNAFVLEAPIHRVRLHPDEAWVTRSGRVRLPEAGVFRIQIKDLPSGLRVEDLQASARGTSGLRLGDVSVASEVRVITETPEWKKLEAERDALRLKRDELESESEASRQELDYLKGIQAAHDKELSTRMAYTTPAAAPILQLGDGVQKRTAELLIGERRRKRDLERLAKEEARLDAEMRKRSAGQRTAPSRVTVELSAAQAGTAEVELSYRTRAARWRPHYEARLSEDRKRLDLALYAAIQQSSGENWPDISLEISNARPSRNLSVPAYDGGQAVGWMNESPKEELSKVYESAAMERSSNVMTQAMAPAPSVPLAGGVQRDKEAEESSASVIEEASGLAATFRVEGTKDVPSDNEPHRFKVLVRELEPKLTVFATPRLDPTAFLLARFAAPVGLPLFPGSPVVRFAGNQRLGEAPLSIPSAGQPFALGFGPYKAVRVSFRNVEHKLETVGAFTKERQYTLVDRIELTNDGNDALELEIQDRILKSASDQVKINLLPGFAPGWTEPIPGVRSWHLRLEPKAQQSLNLPVSVRIPKDGFATGIELSNPGGE